MLSMCLLLVFYYMECRRMAKSDISYVIRKSTTGLKAHVSAIDKRVLDCLVEGIIEISSCKYTLTEKGKHVVETLLNLEEVKRLAEKLKAALGA